MHITEWMWGSPTDMVQIMDINNRMTTNDNTTLIASQNDNISGRKLLSRHWIDSNDVEVSVLLIGCFFLSDINWILVIAEGTVTVKFIICLVIGGKFVMLIEGILLCLRKDPDHPNAIDAWEIVWFTVTQNLLLWYLRRIKPLLIWNDVKHKFTHPYHPASRLTVWLLAMFIP